MLKISRYRPSGEPVLTFYCDTCGKLIDEKGVISWDYDLNFRITCQQSCPSPTTEDWAFPMPLTFFCFLLGEELYRLRPRTSLLQLTPISIVARKKRVKNRGKVNSSSSPDVDYY